MNSCQWNQIYEFDTMNSYIWIHILMNSYAYEFINEFRISTIEFIYMNSCTHQFIWLFPSSSMKSYRLWIHKIMSYMNSYVFWIHDKLLLHVTTHLCYEASEQDRHVHGQQHGAIKRVRKGDRGKGRMGGREGERARGRERGREGAGRKEGRREGGREGGGRRRERGREGPGRREGARKRRREGAGRREGGSSREGVREGET